MNVTLKFRLWLATTVVLSMLGNPAFAQSTYYWDNNGATSGFGTANGTWANASGNATQIGWTTAATGNVSLSDVTTATNDSLNFGTNTTSFGLATGTITVSGTVNAGNMTYGSQSGSITLSGGTLNFGATPVITVNTASPTLSNGGTPFSSGTWQFLGNTATGVVLSGAGTTFTKSGVGALVLGNATAFNPGAIALTQGTLYVGAHNATSLNSGNYTGTITLSNNSTYYHFGSSTQIYSGNITGNGNFTKGSSGTITLSGNNTYTGKTSFRPQQANQAITANVSSFNSVGIGGFSSLGAPNSTANGTIDLGNSGVQAGVTLVYNGTTETTDRVLNWLFNNTSVNHTLTANNGAGLLKFTSAMTSSGTGGSLILRGSGNGEITQGLPAMGGAALTKNDAGTWTLGGSGNVTGATTISGGILNLASSTALQSSPLNTTSSVTGNATAGLRTAVTTLTLGGLTGNKNLSGVFTTTSGNYTGLTSLTLNPGSGATPSYAADIGNGNGTLVLNKTGAGTQTFTAANTHSGGTNINGGTLVAGHNSALGGGAVTIANTGSHLRIGNGISVSNDLTINGGGTTGMGIVYVASGEAGTYSGNITINAGAGAGGHFGSDTATGTGILTLSGAITSNATAVAFRSGTVIVSNPNSSYSALTLNQGTLRIGATNAIPVAATATLAASAAGNLDLAGFNQTLAGVQQGANAASIGSSSTTNNSLLTTTGTSTYNGVIQDTLGSGNRTVSLRVNGGSLTLGGANTYTGGTSVDAGTLALGASDRLANGGAVTIGGGVFDLGSFNETVGAFAMSSGSLNGSGTLTASSYALSGGTVNAKLGTGNITVNTGTVALGSAGRFNSASALTVTGGTLTLGGNETVASFQQTGGTIGGTGILASSATYDMQAGSVSANLGGGVGLTKTTGGTTTLSGNNTYSGGTTVSAGTLLVNNTSGSGTGTGGVTVNGGTLGGAGIISGLVTINAGGTLAPGNSPGQLTVDSLSLGGTTTMELGGTTIGSLYDNVTVNTTDGLTYGGALSVVNYGLYDMSTSNATYDLFSFTGNTIGSFSSVLVNSLSLTNSNGTWSGTSGNTSYSFSQLTGDLTILVVPEPGTLALAAAGVAGGIAILCRRRFA